MAKILYSDYSGWYDSLNEIRTKFELDTIAYESRANQKVTASDMRNLKNNIYTAYNNSDLLKQILIEIDEVFAAGNPVLATTKQNITSTLEDMYNACVNRPVTGNTVNSNSTAASNSVSTCSNSYNVETCSYGSSTDYNGSNSNSSNSNSSCTNSTNSNSTNSNSICSKTCNSNSLAAGGYNKSTCTYSSNSNSTCSKSSCSKSTCSKSTCSNSTCSNSSSSHSNSNSRSSYSNSNSKTTNPAVCGDHPTDYVVYTTFSVNAKTMELDQ